MTDMSCITIRQDPDNSELNALQDFVGGFSGKRVLEIGCGAGRLTFQYAAQATLVHAIDPSEKKIAEAHQNLPLELHGRVTFWNTGIEDYTPPQKYDIALMAWSL